MAGGQWFSISPIMSLARLTKVMCERQYYPFREWCTYNIPGWLIEDCNLDRSLSCFDYSRPSTGRKTRWTSSALLQHHQLLRRCPVGQNNLHTICARSTAGWRYVSDWQTQTDSLDSQGRCISSVRIHKEQGNFKKQLFLLRCSSREYLWLLNRPL